MSAADLFGRAAQGPLTIADLPLDVQGVRIELIDGSLYVTPLGDFEHQRLISDYTYLIRPHVPAGLEVLAGVNVIVGEQTLVEPDIAVVDPSFVTRNGLGVSPDGLLFIAEITSPSTRRRDLTEKRELYREWKVPYLIIDRATDPFTMRTEGNLPPYAQLLADLGQSD
jgi:Uma2 family endonuclease